MTCQDKGTLQAYLDGEVSREQKKGIMKHLESCPSCRESIEELQNLQSFCEGVLEAKDASVDTEAAWVQFSNNLQMSGTRIPSRDEELRTTKGWRTLKTKTKRLLLSGAAAAALISTLAFPQVRGEAEQFLSLFRVNEFKVVTLTQNDLREIKDWVNENGDGSLDLKGIGKMDMSKAAEEAAHFDTAQSAAAAGYSVPDFGAYGVEGVDVVPASTMTFTLDVEKANQMLNQLGSDQQFESLLDGKPFTVSTFEAVRTDYSMDGQHVSYMHTKSPEINVPDGVSIEQLRATLLSLPFLPENVKTQLAGIENIESTLPIPYAAREGSEMTEVMVDGAEGFALESNEHSYLVWQENGEIHSMFAEGKMAADALLDLGERVQ